MNPYLVCHIVSSIDGRINDKRWPIGGEVFEASASTIKADGWIVGRATMQEFSSKKIRRKRKGPETIDLRHHLCDTNGVT